MKKRFGFINMTVPKEVEETIINDGKQMKELYDKIEELKLELSKKNIIIKEKDIEIKLLKEKNEAYEVQINTFKSLINDKNILDSGNIVQKDIIYDSKLGLLNLNKAKEILKNSDLKLNDFKSTVEEEIKNDVPDNNNVNNIDFIKSDFKFKFNYPENSKSNIKDKNIDTQIPTPSISNDSSNTDDGRIKMLKSKIIKVLIISYYKNKYIKLTKNKEKELNNKSDDSVNTENINNNNNKIPIKKIRPERNRDLPILDRFKVKIIKNEDLKDSEILQFVGSEVCFLIEYQYKIAGKLNKNVENITLDDVIDFKIKYEGMRNLKSRRTEIKHLITRSKYLFEKYDKKLSRFKISLYHLKIMSDDEWNEWIKEFDKVLNEVINKEKTCTHAYKNNKICGKLNCKIKHKDNI